MADRGVPATWLVTDDELPADPLPALVAAGCRPELSGWVRGATTAAVLARLNASTGPSIHLDPVRTPSQVHQWLDVAAAVWGEELDDPPGERERRGRLVHDLGLSPGEALQHWVARDSGGRALGNTSAFYDPVRGKVLVEHLNTVPAARRRGVATSLLSAVLHLAVRRGCRWTMLEPSPNGAALYDVIGLDVERSRVPRQYYLPV